MEKNYVKINKKDVERLMNEVKPSKAKVRIERDICYFEFSNYEDHHKAMNWIYSNCDFEVEADGKVIGAIYYEKRHGFCFICDDDGHTETKYRTANKAEDALLEYYYSR